MVLGGLAIALGEVVDDAFIDTEKIFRRLCENRHATTPRAAWDMVFRASMEVRSSVVYATFIIALVFVPLLTLGGVAGKLFSPLGIAYILAIMASLVTALGLMPLALGSGEPGREIEGPMAAVIVGGLATSTILNLLIVPTVLLHFGRFAAAEPSSIIRDDS